MAVSAQAAATGSGPLLRMVLLGPAGLLTAPHHLDDGGGTGLASAGEETGRSTK